MTERHVAKVENEFANDENQTAKAGHHVVNVGSHEAKAENHVFKPENHVLIVGGGATRSENHVATVCLAVFNDGIIAPGLGVVAFEDKIIAFSHDIPAFNAELLAREPCIAAFLVVNPPAPSDSRQARMTPFARPTTDQRRATTAHEFARPSSVNRLPSFVVFALSSIIRHLSSVLCALRAFVVNAFSFRLLSRWWGGAARGGQAREKRIDGLVIKALELAGAGVAVKGEYFAVTKVD
jgi:hypothetical protein